MGQAPAGSSGRASSPAPTWGHVRDLCDQLMEDEKATPWSTDRHSVPGASERGWLPRSSPLTGGLER